MQHEVAPCPDHTPWQDDHVLDTPARHLIFCCCPCCRRRCKPGTPANRDPRDFVPTTASAAVHAGRLLDGTAATDFFGHRVDPAASGTGFA